MVVRRRMSDGRSMDIQVASNFERFLYYCAGRDPARCARSCRPSRRRGVYRFEHFDADTFTARIARTRR